MTPLTNDATHTALYQCVFCPHLQLNRTDDPHTHTHTLWGEAIKSLLRFTVLDTELTNTLELAITNTSEFIFNMHKQQQNKYNIMQLTSD